MLLRYFLAVVLVCASCFAQDTPPDQSSRFYKLDFTVKELTGGKVTNSRSYVTIGRSQKQIQSIRTGDKVPVSQAMNTWSYIDVGVKIDVLDLVQSGNDLRLNLTADISSAEKDPALPQPIIRHTTWSSNVVLPLRKPTVLFSSDATGSKSQTQLELVATPLQ
jgi:hypothetical protein